MPPVVVDAVCSAANPVMPPGFELAATITGDAAAPTLPTWAPPGAPSSFSLAGPWVDVAAPGEGIVSLDSDGEGLVSNLPTVADPMPISGTSYAAPVVSGETAATIAAAAQPTSRPLTLSVW